MIYVPQSVDISALKKKGVTFGHIFIYIYIYIERERETLYIIE